MRHEKITNVIYVRKVGLEGDMVFVSNMGQERDTKKCRISFLLPISNMNGTGMGHEIIKNLQKKLSKILDIRRNKEIDN